MAASKKNYNKYYFVGGLLVIPLFLLILASFSQKPSSQFKEASISKRTIKPTAAPQQTIAPSQTVPFTQTDYTLNYPQDWKETTQNVVGKNGSISVFEPKSSQSKSPHLAIQSMEQSQASIETMSNRYKTLGFTEEDITLANVSAKKLSGSLKTSKGVLHSITYFISSKGKIYIIKSGYMSDSVDQQLEEDFNQILASLSLN